MDAETLLLETEESMLKAVDFAKQEFSGVRTGKASPGLVENLDVHVSSYGSVMKLKGLAVISTPEPRLILIQPFDPSTVHDIGRAINESKLNLNPLVEGRSIRLPIPALTEERRKDLVKLVKSQAEEARVRVRGARKAAMDSAKKLKAENIVTEDGQRDLETQIQKLTDKYVKEIDELVAVKELLGHASVQTTMHYLHAAETWTEDVPAALAVTTADLVGHTESDPGSDPETIDDDWESDVGPVTGDLQ